MRKIFSLVTILTLSSVSTLSSVACNNNSKTYYDDRTPMQLEDAKFILDSDAKKFDLNPNKHVLLLGFDGVPFANLAAAMINESTFKANYYIQNYETVKGWTSILWGNILQKEKNIFNLIKDDNSALKTANILQWLGPYYYNNIYGSETAKYLDYNVNFTNEGNLENYNTIEKMQQQIDKLQSETQARINENYNFIFAYNTYYDQLKHEHYLDDDALLLALIDAYKGFVNQFYTTLNKDDWLIIVTTDHGRNNIDHGFHHSDDVVSAHFAWTLANNNLSTILNHAFDNYYDIRTVAMEWLMQK